MSMLLLPLRQTVKHEVEDKRSSNGNNEKSEDLQHLKILLWKARFWLN